ncbi:hypothetical protein HETIRDRAFT_448404 [Heterobasidion irregulare TC 32-1]|uniref:Uncharacterized protein n=1 Tax=Heterobasidion irregulare (strain TC 32-1) TaxID=747525 RepID=W4KIT4_HETIT|nr:uncharacterized protein HETIRDRAFT_448404 [Heterobasidion irregulare TC 32-1]ETW85230.1 hypothetical protein HETIRDRAFT_448404 [Heterobasidion irregulare TC 32-1]
MAATVEDHTGPSRTNESDQFPLASVSARNRISIDAFYAPEMVEFWAKKYQDAKNELDLLKRHLFTQPDRNELQQEQKSLKTLVSQLKSESRARAAHEKELTKTVVKAQQQKDKWREEVVRFEKERTETVRKVADLEAQNEALKQSRTSMVNVMLWLRRLIKGIKPVQLPETLLDVLGPKVSLMTKVIHCRQVASAGLPPDQSASLPAQMTMKRRYETGEWSVPCFSLRCVGFNVDLYNGLPLAVEELMRPMAALEKRPVGPDAENDAVNKRIRITQSPGRPLGNGTDVSPAQSSSLTYDPHPELNPENILAGPHSS